MIRALAAVALNSFREARRHRISVVVAAFAVALLLSTSLVADVTVGNFARVITDFGLGAMSISLVLLTVFFSCSQLSREIERKTIFLMVAKPISRGEFLVARFAGNLFTMAVLIALMSAVFASQVLMNGEQLTAAQANAIVMLWFELMVLASVGFVVSSFSSPMVSAVVTTGVYFAGHLSEDIYSLASRARLPAIKALGRAIFYALPNLDRLNYRPRAAYDIPTALPELLASAGYATAYATVMISIAVLLFGRRDFK